MKVLPSADSSAFLSLPMAASKCSSQAISLTARMPSSESITARTLPSFRRISSLCALSPARPPAQLAGATSTTIVPIPAQVAAAPSSR